MFFLPSTYYLVQDFVKFAPKSSQKKTTTASGLMHAFPTTTWSIFCPFWPPFSVVWCKPASFFWPQSVYLYVRSVPFSWYLINGANDGIPTLRVIKISHGLRVYIVSYSLLLSRAYWLLNLYPTSIPFIILLKIHQTVNKMVMAF